MGFSSGPGIACKNQQRDIDLMVLVLLDERKEIWEAEPKLPMFGTSTRDCLSD
jgi:hypothetical protein